MAEGYCNVCGDELQDLDDCHNVCAFCGAVFKKEHEEEEEREQHMVEVIEVLVFSTSPDSNMPECICSVCRKDFRNPEDPQDHEFPLRMFHGDEGSAGESRFHTSCFERIFTLKDGNLQARPDVRIDWVPEAQKKIMIVDSMVQNQLGRELDERLLRDILKAIRDIPGITGEQLREKLGVSEEVMEVYFNSLVTIKAIEYQEEF